MKKTQIVSPKSLHYFNLLTQKEISQENTGFSILNDALRCFVKLIHCKDYGLLYFPSNVMQENSRRKIACY